jgi:thiol-disulfide isomerase/thioredoxin
MRTPAVLLLAAALAVAQGCTSDPTPSPGSPVEKTSGESVVVEVNSKAPAFAGSTLDGKAVRLADYAGTHVVLLEFWSIFCKSCIEEMPHIEALYERYRDEGLAVLSVNTDVFSAQRVRSFLDKLGIHPPYPVVRDVRQEIVNAFGVELLPVTVIIDREGWIRLYQEGYRPGDERLFESRIRGLLGKREADDVTLAPRGGVTAFAPAGAALAAPGHQVAPREAATVDGGSARVGGESPQLLYFWSLYCDPCRREYPEVAALGGRYRDRGLETYSVNVDSARLLPRVRRFAESQPGLPCLLDDPEAEGGPLAGALGVRVTPTVVLLGPGGTVLYAQSGTGDVAGAEDKLRELFRGE